MDVRSLRDKSDTDFLVEYFQNLPTCATLHQLTVKLKTLNRFTTPNRDAQIQCLVLGRVILTRLRLRDDDMFDLGSRQGRLGSERLQGLPT